MKERHIKEIVKGMQTTDGAGVHLTRVLSKPNIYDFDPFLMLDSFDSSNPEDYIKGFPWHPHRGIETVTYLVSGEIEHQDSIGNKGVIRPGGSQWMSAGSGILHQEMPQESDYMLGFQLWINMPKDQKMAAPEYNELNIGNEINTYQDDNVVINVISGEYKSVKGFQPNFVNATILDVNLKENSSFEYDISLDETLFVFTMKGEAIIDSQNIDEKSAVLMNDGDKIKVESTDTSLRFQIFHGKPLNEPIAWAGPIVMNTKEEISLAFEELENGKFIK